MPAAARFPDMQATGCSTPAAASRCRAWRFSQASIIFLAGSGPRRAEAHAQSGSGTGRDAVAQSAADETGPKDPAAASSGDDRPETSSVLRRSCRRPDVRRSSGAASRQARALGASPRSAAVEACIADDLTGGASQSRVRIISDRQDLQIAVEASVIFARTGQQAAAPARFPCLALLRPSMTRSRERRCA